MSPTFRCNSIVGVRKKKNISRELKSPAHFPITPPNSNTGLICFRYQFVMSGRRFRQRSRRVGDDKRRDNGRFRLPYVLRLLPYAVYYIVSKHTLTSSRPKDWSFFCFLFFLTVSQPGLVKLFLPLVKINVFFFNCYLFVHSTPGLRFQFRFCRLISDATPVPCVI